LFDAARRQTGVSIGKQELAVKGPACECHYSLRRTAAGTHRCHRYLPVYVGANRADLEGMSDYFSLVAQEDD
jgi:hypothetical protein